MIYVLSIMHSYRAEAVVPHRHGVLCVVFRVRVRVRVRVRGARVRMKVKV